MATQATTSPRDMRQAATAGQNASVTEQTRSRTPAAGQGALQRPQSSGYPSGLSRNDQSRSPFATMGRFMEEMDRMFESMGFGGGLSRSPSIMGGLSSMRDLWAPDIEVFQKDGQLVVRADLPGIPQDAISVQVEGDVLTISGERHDDRNEQRDGYYHSERSYGSFHRSIALPEGVSHDDIQAHFENGVLQVAVPLPEQKKPSGRKIEIGKRPAETPTKIGNGN